MNPKADCPYLIGQVVWVSHEPEAKEQGASDFFAGLGLVERIWHTVGRCRRVHFVTNTFYHSYFDLDESGASDGTSLVRSATAPERSRFLKEFFALRRKVLEDLIEAKKNALLEAEQLLASMKSYLIASDFPRLTEQAAHLNPPEKNHWPWCAGISLGG